MLVNPWQPVNRKLSAIFFVLWTPNISQKPLSQFVTNLPWGPSPQLSVCFVTGAGFYVDATEEKWKRYRMYSYVTKELPELLRQNTTSLNLENASIMGHSMGGHGALTIALKNPGTFKSASAFAPICNPTKCPWGNKGMLCMMLFYCLPTDRDILYGFCQDNSRPIALTGYSIDHAWVHPLLLE